MERREKESARHGNIGDHEDASESTARQSASTDMSDVPPAGGADTEPGMVLTDEELENVYGGLSLDWEIDW